MHFYQFLRSLNPGSEEVERRIEEDKMIRQVPYTVPLKEQPPMQGPPMQGRPGPVGGPGLPGINGGLQGVPGPVR